MACKDLVQLIGERVQHLPKDSATPRPGMEVEFKVDGLRRILVFLKGPLGLTFNGSSASPFAVANVFSHSQGAKSGVEPGWELKRVGDYLVGDDWGATMRVLSDGSACLPRY